MLRRIAISIPCLALVGSGQLKQSPPVSQISLAEESHQSRILRGVYPGKEGWRWTAQSFAVSLDPPPPGKATFLELDFSLPQEVMSQTRAITLTAKVNGVEAARQRYARGGRYVFACRVSPQALKRRPAEVEFALDQSIKDPGNGRVVGLIAVSVGLKEYEQTAQFRDAQLRLARQAYEAVLKQRALQMPLEKQRELMKVFHELPIWQSLWFHNVRIIKNPLDLWMMQQIAYELRPDFVIETGTWYGGSALYWAHTLNGMGLENARVLTVDIQDLAGESGASAHPLWKKYVEFSHGSSTDPAIVSKIAQRVRSWKTIVNLDSDHSMQHVLRELRMYSPLVTPGSYLLVEDTHLDGVPTHPEQGAGPMAAVRQFLAEGGGKEFEQDFTREALVMTSYPGGWLRRKVTQSR